MKLIKKLIEIYKIPVLVSITFFVAFAAIKTLRAPVDISLAFLGSFLGTFFLDLDYILYAYFTDSSKDFSRTLRGYFKHGDYTNAIAYAYYHRSDVKEKTLQSVLFQVVVGALSIFMIFAPINYFAKTFIISIYVNSLYRLAESYFKNDTSDWFWMLKEKPTKNGVKVYLIISVIILLIGLQFL